MEPKKLTPSERARLAGKKRRVQERKDARAAGKGFFDGTVYSSMIVGLIAVWSVFLYRAVQSPSPYPIGEITAPRVQLRDGRHVAYSEMGASAQDAKYHVLVLHGWRVCRLTLMPNITESELQELGVRLVSYDRPGYGQSDPLPGRTAKTEAEDIDEIADLLHLGNSFYVLGYSWGGIPAWATVKYIPKRIKGVALVSPLGDFWARSMSNSEMQDAWMWLTNPDRYSLLVARHAPRLLHLWMTQKLVPRAFWGGAGGVPRLAAPDLEILAWPTTQENYATINPEAERQGPTESVYRDMQIAFGSWPFEVTEIPLGGDADFQGDIHVYQGGDDWVVPPPSNRFVAKNLVQVKYTEVDDEGHLFFLKEGWSKRVLTDLLGLAE